MKTLIKRIFGLGSPAEERYRIPVWFKPNDLRYLKNELAFAREKPTFLYQSWIPEHTDKLIDQLESGSYRLTDLKMFHAPHEKATRKEILRFSEENEQLFRKMALHKLAPYIGRVSGIIVTLDWIPAFRHLIIAASQLGMPTILVPHESVFARRDLYYVHPRLGINLPACDIVCAWGDLQAEIFSERGYPAHRIIKTGAPKFDYIPNLRGNGINRAAVTALGLRPDKPVVTFISQPLDSQYDTAKAREAQERALLTLVEWIRSRADVQLIVRTPPSRDSVFSDEILGAIEKLPNGALDDANLYMLSAEQTIACSDVIVSINSTMLLEAALCGRVAISSKFIEFDQIWDMLRIPKATTPKELIDLVGVALTEPATSTAQYDLAWASTSFSTGGFDGLSASRISKVLGDVAAGKFSELHGYAAELPFS